MKELLDKSRNLIRLWIASFLIQIVVGILSYGIPFYPEKLAVILIFFLIPLLVLTIVIFIKEFKLFFDLRDRWEMEEDLDNKQKLERLKRNIGGVLILEGIALLFTFFSFRSISTENYWNQDSQLVEENFPEEMNTFKFFLGILDIALKIVFFMEFKKIRNQNMVSTGIRRNEYSSKKLREINRWEIIENSAKTIRFWNLTTIIAAVVFLFLILLISIINSGGNPIFLIVILFLLFFFGLITWIIGFIRGIMLYQLLNNKYKYMVLEGAGNINREEFEIISDLKNTVLLAVILDFLFFIPSLFVKHSYKKKIRKLEENEHLLNSN